MKLPMKNKTQRMMTSFSIQKVILFLSIVLLLPAFGFAAEKSYIVGFHRKPGTEEKERIKNSKGHIKRSFNLINAMVVTLPEEEFEKLKKDKNIAYISEDMIYTATVPLPGNEYAESWGVEHISADLVHLTGNKGAGIKIAVIDTGIDDTHEDLDDNYVDGYDFVFDDDDPYDDNTISHGTHVAGIIAAEDNDFGVIGVAPEASLFAVKVLDGGGFGLTSWIISGIEWAVNNGMDIINISIQGGDDPALEAACNSAYEAGVIIIAAAGNTDGGSVTYPAVYDSVVAVTGTDLDDISAYFSPVGVEIYVAAPGLDIQSTTEGDSYNVLSGTSQAAPHITGVAALFLASGVQDQNENGFINDEIIDKIKNYALDLGNPGFDNIYGYGRVSAVCPDSDSDGICNDVDNCPNIPNPGQEDADNDGTGDAGDSDTIYGTITGAIVEGVTVQLYVLNCGGNTDGGSAVTNSEGYYAIGGLDEFRHTVNYDAPGYSFAPAAYWAVVPNEPGKSYDATSTAD
jgi:subtilisin